MLVGIAGAGFDDLFIVTKVQPPRFTADEVAGRLYASRERLKRFPTVVVNHWIPADSDICDVVKSLEAAVAKGLATYYGLSDVSGRRLEAALTCARRIEPAVVENLRPHVQERRVGRVAPGPEVGPPIPRLPP
ncbi:MAG: aldo/keto reductase [Pyrobaculum sp.]|nr:aldo/keto reductase [Pyrobaculum sp.]